MNGQLLFIKKNMEQIMCPECKEQYKSKEEARFIMYYRICKVCMYNLEKAKEKKEGEKKQ